MLDPPLLAPLFQDDELEGLESMLQQLLVSGRDACPNVPLSAERFVRHLRKHCPPAADPLTALPPLYIEDLYLACACAHHLIEGLHLFEQRHLVPLASVLPRSQADPAVVDELRQRVRERLLVASGVPRIAEYEGRGSLGSFVRSVAVRLLRDLQRQRAAGPVHLAEDGAMIEVLDSDPDPEVAFLKGRYRQAFQQALQDALEGLPAEQRNVLRLHYVDHLNLDQIGVVLGVHRSTVQRWRSEAVIAAQRAARALVCQRLDLPALQYDSLARLVRSQLELHLTKK